GDQVLDVAVLLAVQIVGAEAGRAEQHDRQRRDLVVLAQLLEHLGAAAVAELAPAPEAVQPEDPPILYRLVGLVGVALRQVDAVAGVAAPALVALQRALFERELLELRRLAALARAGAGGLGRGEPAAQRNGENGMDRPTQHLGRHLGSVWVAIGGRDWGARSGPRLWA